MAKGFVYLVAIMDGYTRRVTFLARIYHPGYQLPNRGTERGIGRYECPEMSNTKKVNQFTSEEFTQALEDKDIRIKNGRQWPMNRQSRRRIGVDEAD